jgi:adenine-specific DNA-methyltransferase
VPPVGQDRRMPTDTTAPATELEYGEVFTRRWVVELILDLSGYTPDRDLGRMVAVEPSCGSGAFLGPMVRRLCQSLREHGRTLDEARGAIVAFDLLERNVAAARGVVSGLVVEAGWDPATAAEIAHGWVNCDDYLLREHRAESADFVLGNPPYIRLEDIDPARAAHYRHRCPTMGGRADIYVGFFEVGLRSLAVDGVLGFICADRWMRNQYGAKLRAMVAQQFSLDAAVIMHDVDAFDEVVSAYPAITVLRNAPQGPSIVADTTRDFDEGSAAALVSWCQSERRDSLAAGGVVAAQLPGWFGASESWPAGSPARLALLEDLNERFHPLEDEATGTRVGIGVATGADRLFVAEPGRTPNVERDRLLPLAMSKDTVTGTFAWSGHHLVNPWTDGGELVDLADYPRLADYFETHGEKLRARNVAGRQPHRWYRTIDKVEHSLVAREKLLFPDMKMTSHPVLERGDTYPHHGLYFIVSEKWDLRVLGGLLLSKVAEFFVDTYAVKMRGGTLRFQAQYLRRIRVPRPEDISNADAQKLAEAFDRRDVVAATDVALRVYGVDRIPE